MTEAAEEDEDEDIFGIAPTWPEAPDEDLKIVNGVNFTFSSHMGTYIRHYRRVWADTAGSLEVDYTEAEMAGVDFNRYYAHDLEKLELIGRIVQAPQKVFDALKHIKAHPIEVL
jgi:hypothetical protein